MDGIVCLSNPTKCLGVDTSLVGDTGLFSIVDGPASSWNLFHGSVSCSPCLRAYVAGYLPPVGSYGFHSLGGDRGGVEGGGSMGRKVSSIGLSGSGSGTSSSGMVAIGLLSSIGLSDSSSDLGSMYNSIKECSRWCPWLQRRGERARSNGEGGLGGPGRGLGCLGGDGDWVGDKGRTTGGTWGWDSCGKADGKMTAWLLINGAGVVDRAGSDDKEGGKNNGKEERNLSHALFRLMVAFSFECCL